jgi:hypothetical protein
MRGAWAGAEKKFAALLQRSSRSPQVLRNLALVRGWLADSAGAIEALNEFASLDVSREDLPLDDAIEAAALAQLLDRGRPIDKLDTVSLAYPVGDIEALEVALASDAEVDRVDFDPAVYTEAGEPPPRAVYWLLDRPLPPTGVDIAADAIPHVRGRLFLFGRQTDREARLELVTNRNDRFETICQAVVRLGGDALGPAGEAEVVGQTTVTSEVLGWSWRMPDDTPPDHRQALVAEQREHVILNVWPTVSLPIFDGRSAEDAAADPAMQVKILAAILLLEFSADEGVDQIDFNSLRERLGLPTLGAIDPTDESITRISLTQLARVEVDKLADDDLVANYRRAAMSGARRAIQRLAGEVVRRPSLDGKIDKPEAYGYLAELEPDARRALDLIDEARKCELAAGGSPARWLLAELAQRIDCGDLAKAQHLIGEIRAKHFQEEGIAQGLLQILQAAGVVGPDGMPVGPPPEDTSGVVVPSSASEDSAEIWTPNSEKSARGDKPAIWTPGMD